MPLIHLEYDNAAISENDARSLSITIREIVAEETKIDDVSVDANSAQIKVQIAPIEIFVAMSAHKIDRLNDRMAPIKSRLTEWKKQIGFTHLINVTFIPMTWKMEIGI